MVKERQAMLDALVPLAHEARKIILEVYETPFEVFDKGGNDPVTVADKRVNALICESLERLFPGVLVVAEESDEARYAGFEHAPEAFFVDPLDGTREFVARNGEFVIMVGFAEAGRASLGLVLAPVTGKLWTGIVGLGAAERGPDGERPLSLAGSTVVSPDQARFVVSRSRRSPDLNAFLDRARVKDCLPLGSAGLKATAVASGQADAYVQLGGAGCLWDTCAPEAIVVAAGGLFTQPDGSPLRYQASQVEVESGVVVAPPRLHEAILRGLTAG